MEADAAVDGLAGEVGVMFHLVVEHAHLVLKLLAALLAPVLLLVRVLLLVLVENVLVVAHVVAQVTPEPAQSSTWSVSED